ncbi:MAG: hypothetical protein RIR00_740 [Pseudomonadota bacterium]|jgi:SAM-dependent methyltransferase
MVVLPPGTLLQLMYFEERISQLPPGRFIEIGPGGGEITAILLRRGWVGTVVDLAATTIARLEERFQAEVASGSLWPCNGNFLALPCPGDEAEKVDLVVSCMVMEHLDAADELRFMAVAASWLRPGGIMIGLVPASEKHWGIEDEIAGHFRRYTRESLQGLLTRAGWQRRHLAGLTYPVSNLLFPISNWLVNRYERNKLKLEVIERTKKSGARNVPFKTSFPLVLRVLLNRKTLWPLHVVQKLCSRKKNALVIFFEAIPPRTGHQILEKS